MTTPQTFYAVLDSDGHLVAGVSYENANKAEEVAKREAKYWRDSLRVIAYTVIATFGGSDE